MRLILRKLFSFFRSTLLALILLVTILILCVIGTAVLPEQAGRVAVFSSLWFNALLVLLVLNVAFCFFSRIRRKDWDLISAGMIIFHLSFVSMFAGIIIDSLFHYRGTLRLTEGETMALNDPNAYDEEYWGHFFYPDRMRGLVTFHTHIVGHKAGGQDKGVAFDISVMEGEEQVRGVIYPTRHINFRGFRFFQESDGFAPLFILYDRFGRELYGAYTTLQSFKQKDGTYLFTTGTKQEGPGSASFPQIPNMPPLFKVQFTYHPQKSAGNTKEASFKVWEYDEQKKSGQGRLLYQGAASRGEKIAFGDYALSMQEVRRWGSMSVHYDPGMPTVLASLWAGLSGLVITFIGRMRRGRKQSAG